MKKLISIILCLTFILGLAVVASAAKEPAVLDFSNDANRTMQNEDQQIWEANGVKLTNDRGSSTQPIKDYFNPIRLYAKTSVTIEYPGMTSIVLVCPTEGYAEVWANNPGDAAATITYEADTGSANYIVTITFAAPTDSYTVTELTKQTRIRQMTVYAGNESAAPETPEVPEEPVAPSIVDIATALAGKDGDTFAVKGVVTCIEGGKNVYIMDETGGICIRNSANVEGLAVGDTIIGTGSKSVYNGLTQLNGSYEKSEGMELAANETTIDSLTAADICTYIKLSGVTVTEVFDNNGAYTNPNITVTDGTNSIQIYKAVVDGVKVGDTVDVYAAVGCYKETLQLRNTNASEITVVGEGTPDVPDVPDVPETPDVPEVKPVIIESGKYVIYAPAFNKALSSTYTGFYNNGVDVTLSDGTLSGYGETEIWIITCGEDGVITIVNGENKLAMGAEFSSMPLNEVNDTWILEEAGDGLYYIKNVVRGNYVEWYDAKSNWSSYGTIGEGKEGLFQMALYPIVEGEPEDPVDPPVVDPEIPEEPTPGTGDMGLGAVVVALMAATAGAIVITKKKDF